ncbi:MAG TPA: hypothetical protein VFU21_13360, partial [Kofleriaceae bacterium]|nr:hypothetical protein [Kofleriaceae bacterium]
MRYLSVLAGVLAASAPARADRAVGPVDRLSPWTLELGGALSYADRNVTTVTAAAGEAPGDESEVVVAPWMRVWLTDAIEVGIRQPISGRDNGDVELSSSLVVGRGALSGGTSLALVLPTGGWSFSSERIAVSAAALGAWRAFPGGHLFVRPSYTARAGDYPLDAADAAALEIGLAARARALSLVPRLSAERTLDLGGGFDGFTTWRGGVEAAVEITRDVTASARIDWAGASAHTIDSTGAYGRASEVVSSIGLAWAWDLGSQRA